jgi:hypothetical protein
MHMSPERLLLLSDISDYFLFFTGSMRKLKVLKMSSQRYIYIYIPFYRKYKHCY